MMLRKERLIDSILLCLAFFVYALEDTAAENVDLGHQMRTYNPFFLGLALGDRSPKTFANSTYLLEITFLVPGCLCAAFNFGSGSFAQHR